MARDAAGTQCWIDNQLGKGSFGTVYRLICSESPGKRVSRLALKVIDQDGVRASQDEQELSIMSRMHHPNIISLVDSFQLEVPQGCFLMLVMELCEEGDLSQYLDTLRTRRRGDMGADEALVVKWTLQLTDALKYLHGQKIIHRDLKPHNIFMKDESNLRIGDLGIARQMLYTRQRAASHVGTPVYMSPEIFKGVPYSYETDIWSLGCCVFEMMALKSAFDHGSLFKLTQEIINKEVVPPPRYSTPLRRLVQGMLSKNSWARPDAETLLAHLLTLDVKRPQAAWRSEDKVKGGKRSPRPQFTEDWRTKTAQAVFTFRAERAASHFAQVSAALVKKATADSDRGGHLSSGGMSSLRPGGTGRGPASSQLVHSESWDVDGEEASESGDSDSLSSAGASDRTWGSSTQVERNACRAVGAILSSDSPSQADGRGGRVVVPRSRHQPGDRPSQLGRQNTDQRRGLRDDSGSSLAASDSEGSDDSSSRTVVPATRLKIGKSSMVVRARPLPQPRLYREQVENSSENQGSLSAGVHPSASVSENDTTPSEHCDWSGRDQKVSNKGVDMAYANEVLQWARARLLPSSEAQACSSRHDNRPASVEEAEVRDAETISSTVKDVVTKKGVRNGVAAQRKADVVRDRQAGVMKEATARTAVGDTTAKETDPADKEWENETGASPDADSTAVIPVVLEEGMKENNRVPVGRGKGKKKKNKVFLRGKSPKADAGEAKCSPKGGSSPREVYQEEKRMMVDSHEETVVVLYPRGQRVTFSKATADDLDLSIGGHSYT